MKSFLGMLSFFTSISVGARFQLNDVRFRRGIKYLPPIALLIGVITAGIFVLGSFVAPYFAALISLAAYIALTGGLHVDGLADTLDGILSRRERSRMLDIMKDSRIGTFGVLGIGVYIAGMIVFSAQLSWIAVALYPLVGRTAGLMAARCGRCTRSGGLGEQFIGSVRTWHVIGAVMLYLVIAAAASTDFAAMSLDVRRLAVLAVPYALAMALWMIIGYGISRRLGGITGDVIGFGIETSQWIFLLLGCVAEALI